MYFLDHLLLDVPDVLLDSLLLLLLLPVLRLIVAQRALAAATDQAGSISYFFALYASAGCLPLKMLSKRLYHYF